MKAVAAKRAGKPWHELQSKADKIASDLLQFLFPEELKFIFDTARGIQHIYFCPDQILAKYPIEIIPFPDGQRLWEKVAIAHLSSARELLRESTLYSPGLT